MSGVTFPCQLTTNEKLCLPYQAKTVVSFASGINRPVCLASDPPSDLPESLDQEDYADEEECPEAMAELSLVTAPSYGLIKVPLSHIPNWIPC
jgi:hypothetical protein